MGFSRTIRNFMIFEYVNSEELFCFVFRCSRGILKIDSACVCPPIHQQGPRKHNIPLSPTQASSSNHDIVFFGGAKARQLGFHNQKDKVIKRPSE